MPFWCGANWIVVGCARASATAIFASGSFNFQEKTHLKNRTANTTTNSVTPAAATIRRSSSLAGSFMGAVQGGQNASDDICSCDLGPDARSHFRRFAGNPDRPASGRSCERCRCRERHAGACVRLALPSITSLASLVLPASSALKSMSKHRTCSGAGPPKGGAIVPDCDRTT